MSSYVPDPGTFCFVQHQKHQLIHRDVAETIALVGDIRVYTILSAVFNDLSRSRTVQTPHNIALFGAYDDLDVGKDRAVDIYPLQFHDMTCLLMGCKRMQVAIDELIFNKISDALSAGMDYVCEEANPGGTRQRRGLQPSVIY